MQYTVGPQPLSNYSRDFAALGRNKSIFLCFVANISFKYSVLFHDLYAPLQHAAAGPCL